MRYEDASQGTSNDVSARDDTEHLAGNDFGPATGNIITGTGTVSGAAGTDMAGPGGHITAIAGAGGSDNSFDASGKLEVAGQYGTLTIDAEGNYTYVRNAGSPEGVSDTFTYTLADAAGATDDAKLVIAIGNPPILQAQGTQTIQTANGVVVLPAGVELSDVHVQGRNLVITLPDGSTMVIPDGAIFVPQLVVNGVEVPASNLAALLIDSEPKPAAGDVSPTQLSSGGNFEVPVSPLDPGVPLGDLIPPTELTYTPPEVKELFPGENNEAPFVGLSSVNVSEEGVSAISLPNPDNSGSPDTTNSPSNPGFIVITDSDGDPLTVSLGTPSESLTSQGVAITWAVSPDGHTLTGSAGGNTVITLVLNNSGNYTVTLSRPVDHPNGGGEQGTSFVVPVTASDGEEVGIGAITVTIEDDSPTIEGRVSEPQLIVDDTTFNINDVDSVTGAFSVSYGADGQAASNPISYAMGINAGATGLFDTLSGQQVVLSLVGGVVIGTAGPGGPEVFRVSVDGSGNVTLDQSRAVVHNDPADPVESGGSAATLASDNLVTVSIVATDRDGDQASITVNIGQNLHFEDDGPSISAASGSEPQLTVDDTTLGSDSSASFAGLFSPVYGNDGQGTPPVAYTLGVSAPGAVSGLVDVASGHGVFLFLESGVVVGREGTDAADAVNGDVVFTVSVDAAGVVTLDQDRAVQHNDPSDPVESGGSAAGLLSDGLVTLTATVKDGDGDTASATVGIGSNLHFEDDGPSITATGSQPSLTVDETTLSGDASASFAGIFAPVFGNDGQGTPPVSYSLGVSAAGANSGLTDSLSGHAVYLFLEGGQVVGREGTSPADAVGGDIVFTVSVDGTGLVTLDQQRAVIHDDPTDPDEASSPATLSADNLVTLVATVKDGDGDTATATANIGQNLNFEDDGPSVTLTQAEEPILTVDETDLPANVGPVSFIDSFSIDFGEDGPASSNSKTFSLTATAGPSGLVDTATGHQVFLFVESGVVVGREGTDVADAAGGDVVFTVSVDSATGDVSLHQERAVQHGDPTDPDEADTPAQLSADDLIKLNVVAKDADGDTATASVSIARNLAFEDDGPSIIASGSEPQLTVDDTTFGTNASASFAGTFITDFGNDGQGTPPVAYALGVSSSGALSGLTDTLSGHAVYLFLEGGVVVGREGTSPADAVSGDIVFTVSIDSAGVVTLDQSRAVVHDNAADPVESGGSAAGLASDNLITVTATIKDGDGDTATASVGIGSNLHFEDDGPSIAPSTVTEPQLTVDDSTFGTNASASFAANFTPVFGNDGPGSPPVAYSLGVSAPGGVLSGLTDTLSGHAVYLFLEGGVVVGREGTSPADAVGGDIVFTVSVDSAGVVTLDQSRSVVHDNPADPVESGLSAAGLSADNLITVIATVKDGDNDTASASVGIGSNLHFEDDGPSIVASGSEPQLTVDDTTFGTNASASFAANFIPTYGNDGQGAPPVAYALGVSSSGALSGLTDTLSGHAVYLFLEGGVVVGREGTSPADAVGGDIVFTVSVDSAGLVTLDQSRAVVHDNPADPIESGLSAAGLASDGLVTLTATVKDGDGDTATATVGIGSNLHFEDDGPSIIASGSEPQLTVDDTTLVTNASASFAGAFIPTYGNDGQGTPPVAYALGVSSSGALSGLVETSSGHAVYLFLESGVVVGREGTSPADAASGDIVFTVSVDSAGLVTLDQRSAVVHDNPADPVESGGSAAGLSSDGLITLTATVKDGDGDTATATVGIGSNLHFEDDGPSITATGTQPTVTVDETILADNASQSFAGAFTPTFGNDGQGTPPVAYSLGISSSGALSGLVETSSGHNVYLFLESGQVVGREGTSPADAVGGDIVFTVSVNSSGVVTLDQRSAVVHDDPLDMDENTSPAMLSADNLITLTATVKDGDNDTATATINIGQNLAFEDDGLSTANDTDSIVGGAGPATGNVITGVDIGGGDLNITDGVADTFGTDGRGEIVKISSNNNGNFDDASSGGNFVVIGQYGTLTINEDGSYSYTRTDLAAAGVSDIFTYTVTDGDGDKATGTLTIGIADNFPQAGNVDVLLDDDALANGIADGPNDRNPDTQNLTGNLPGSGGDNPLAFSFLLTGAPTGFTYVAGVGNQLLIKQGSTTVITITITNNNTGAYTVVQNAPIMHDPQTGTGEDNTENNALFTVNYRVTDNDGDPADGTIHIDVDDDSPTVTAALTQPDLTTDDSTLGTDASTSFAGVFTGGFGADGAAAVNPTVYTLGVSAPGGVNSGVVDVASGHAVYLFLEAGVVVGREGTSPADAVGGDIVFTVSVNSTNGLVTLDQQRAVQHNDPTDPVESGPSAAGLLTDNLVTLTKTVTDADGDSASATANIGSNLHFEDAGPSIVASGSEPQLTVDDTTLGTNASASFAANFIPTYGADGQGTPNVAYALAVSAPGGVLSGLVDTASNHAVYLFLESGQVVGREGTSPADAVGGDIVFTVSVDSAGLVTLDQQRAVQHNDPADVVESGLSAAGLSADNLVQLVATVKDGDGDTATATINIGSNLHFEDDGPTAVKAAAITTGLTNGTGSASANLDGNVGAGGNSIVSDNFGADGPGKVIFTTATTAALTAQHYKHAGVELSYLISPDGQTLTGFVDTTVNGTVDAGETVFTIQLGTGVGGNDYTITMNQTIDTTVTTNFTDAQFDFIGGNKGWFGIVPNGQTPGDAPGPIDDDSHDLLITPTNNTSINTSGILGGVDTGQSVGAGEGFRIDYVVDLTGTPPNNYTNGSASGQILNAGDPVSEANHWYTNGAFVTMRQSTGSDVRFTAYNDTDNDQIVGDGTVDTITKIVITYTNSSGTPFVSAELVKVDTLSHDVTLNGVTFSYQFNADGTVDVHNVQGATGANENPATTVAVYTDTTAGFVPTVADPLGYDSLVVTHIGGDEFKFSGFGAVTTTAAPLDLSVPISIVDGDGDIVSSGNLAIHANAASSAEAVTPKTPPPSVMEPLSLSSSLLTSDTQTADRVAANSNNLALAAAVGAAGIAASSAAAAAPAHDFAALHSMVADGSFARTSFAATFDGEGHGVSVMKAFHGGVSDHGFQALASTSHTAITAGNAGELTTALSAAHAPTALLQATEAAAHGVPAPAVGMDVAMPSVAALVAAHGGVSAQTDNGQVQQIIADALHGGGNGPDINALLNALPGAGIGENAGLHGLATHGGPDVPAWDMGHAGVFTMDVANIMTAAPMVLHHDAVQPVANG